MDEPLASNPPAAEAPAPEGREPPDTEEAEAPERRSLWMPALKGVSIAAVAGVLALLAWATLVAGGGHSLVSKIAAGKKPQAPDFNLGVLWAKTGTWPPAAVAAIGDGKLDLEELRGHPVVVNFWASWCVPCRKEAPILHAGALRHRGQVAFVGIDIQDLRGDALAFARKYKMNYVSVRDRGDGTDRAYGTTGVPETYFIDAQGRIVAHIPGIVSKDTLEEGVAAITRPAG